MICDGLESNSRLETTMRRLEERYQEAENGLSFFFNNKLELGAKIGGQKRKVKLLVAIAAGRSGGGGGTSEGIGRNYSCSWLDCRFSCFMVASVRRRGGAKGKMGAFVHRTHHHRQLLLLLEAVEFTTATKETSDLA
ncbi:hypothetical protein GUJ93_ZPchr0008g13730 [Zizania palustris]|uniref:Uncharacterized protein n=1 Tax=Zizania palustris TaxID=103762 RepID=A0A8J5RL93_ZIZPA|nr:hypothetical protein GUJ93_ZPchr0008g13730 [Zizania palustris]